MKLKEWLDKKGYTYRAFSLVLGGPTHQAVQRYATGLDTPSLEVALMISKTTNGEVELCELLVDGKRKYTSNGDCICRTKVVEDYPETIDDIKL